MKSRFFSPPKDSKTSYFLLGPRGTGKSTWLRAHYPGHPYFDLLEDDLFQTLSTHPQKLETLIPQGASFPVIIDEIQKIPALLDEVHRLISKRRMSFVLTGSSARKLRKAGTNLLAGRALTYEFFPFTAHELGEKDFQIKDCLLFGLLPGRFEAEDPGKFLRSYVATYLREEVMQEGLTRNLAAFSRFLESASFSQGQVLNISQVAQEARVERKVVEDYFLVLEDLLLAVRLPVFRRRAKRKMISHPKFYLFDSGVYQTLRPRGPLDSSSEIGGPALETLVLNELRALNQWKDWGYSLHYWRTQGKVEVDFVLYGPRGMVGIEIKSSDRLRDEDFRGLELLKSDYPVCKTLLVYGGSRAYTQGSVQIIPVREFLLHTEQFV